METPQNNFTTPEQSKRLLELGVPADSADCYLSKGENEDDGIVDYKPFIGKSPAIEGNLFSYRYGYIIPCWSVGQLIWIYCKLTKSINITIPYQSGMLCEVLIRTIEHNKKQLDFSRLKDYK